MLNQKPKIAVMRRLIGGATLAAMLLAAAPAYSGAGYSWPSDAAYSVPRDKMKDALACSSGERYSEGGAGALRRRNGKHPVLLVHGTGVNRRQNWEWNYWQTLRARGWEVCWVNLPRASLGDIQVAAEYVAYALKLMRRQSGQKIDVIGHSQGGLQPRWVIKWFSTARFIADFIAIDAPNHGTRIANESSMDEGCFEACWQMRRRSNFIRALNRDNETPGPIFYSSIYTSFSELVQPTGTQVLRGGASNVLLQDLCPRPVEHVAIAADYVTWLLVRDALLNPGPADPKVVDAEDCLRDRMPGADDPPAGAAALANWTEGEITDREPPLKAYARP